MMRVNIPQQRGTAGPMSGQRSRTNTAPGAHVGGGTPKTGATPNAAAMRNRMAGMLASATPYNAGGGARPFDAFLNGRAGPGEGQSRADWFAANPNMQRQWQAYRQANAGGIGDWRAANPRPGADPDAPRLGLGGHDAQWWRQVGYSPYAVSQLPGALANAGGLNRGYVPVTDWNNPNQIRRAIQSLPMDMSRFANGGAAMGMNYDPAVWGNWRPGDFAGRGRPLDFPNYDLVGGGG